MNYCIFFLKSTLQGTLFLPAGPAMKCKYPCFDTAWELCVRGGTNWNRRNTRDQSKRTLFAQLHADRTGTSFFTMSFFPHKWQVRITKKGSTEDSFTKNETTTRPKVETWYDFEIRVKPDDLKVLRDGRVVAERPRTRWATERGILAKGPEIGIYAVWAKDTPSGTTAERTHLTHFLFFKDI